MHNHHRYQITRTVTIVSVFLNTCLGIFKVLVGWFGHSHALIADGIHSFSDLISDGLVLLVAKVASRGADADHPYGHARIETAASAALSVILVLVGLGVAWQATFELIHPAGLVTPSHYVLWVAAASVAINEFLYHYNLRMGKRINSQLLQVNAWHNRSDAISSVIVFAGALGSLMGLVWFDALAAFIVSLFIIRMGWRFGWESIQELVDTSLDQKTLSAIEKHIESIPGVRALHQLRTRSMAGQGFVDVHILVNPCLSVSEGHYVGEKVQWSLIKHFEAITDVTVHVDPEDDEIVSASKHLPDRNAVLEQLKTCWGDLPGADALSSVTLHYLDGNLKIDIVLPLSVLDETSRETLAHQYQSRVSDLSYITAVKLFFA